MHSVSQTCYKEMPRHSWDTALALPSLCRMCPRVGSHSPTGKQLFSKYNCKGFTHTTAPRDPKGTPNTPEVCPRTSAALLDRVLQPSRHAPR